MLQTNAEELEVGLASTASPRFAHDFSQIPLHPKSPANVQAKLTVGPPGDMYEQEADRVSEQIMHMPEPQLQRAGPCGGGCPKCQTGQLAQEHDRLQTEHVGSGDLGQIAVPPIVDEVLSSPGQPLDPATRTFMEPRFGHDFAKVRVHTNNRAAESVEAVNARAYTVGNHIVFGAGQHEPGGSRGQRLLAHELTHVVQQNDGLRGEATGAHNISRAPAGLLSRDGPISSDEARKKEAARKNEAAKKATIQKHVNQQRKVATFLDNGRKIQPDPKKGLRDPDNLFHNTVELLDRGKLTLTILSPTHSHPNRHFDTRVRFDAQGNHFGGDYPAVPIGGLEGVVENKESAFGQVNLPSPPPSPPTIQTLPPKVERAPGETAPAPEKAKPAPTPAIPPAPAPFAPGDIYYFTRGLDIIEDQFRNTFVHEGQHIADLSPKNPVATSAYDKLENYKTEFRAFWIQPPLKGFGSQAIDHLPEPKGKADNSSKVTISKPEDCKICKPPSASAPAEVKTELKNPRQEAIFWYIMTHYQAQQYDCCYVYDEKFRKAVNAFAYPGSVNLINSNRLIKLNLELPNLNPSMTLTEVNSAKFVALLTQLDGLDWAFLNDPKLSKPFWDALKIAAPGFLYKGVNALVEKGTKNPVSAVDVNKALSGK